MFPLWDIAIAPVLTAVRARRVVEIGALKGETTIQMLEHLGPEAELHVIDPKPAFDPSEHEQQFPGRYVFHEARSHEVLPTLGPVDVALIDGDHNWYTVYHELRMLAEASREAEALLPVLVMHDVGWPYGRRDLYYDPSDVPDEFRQPYRAAGMRPGRSTLMESGGLNPTMFNAETEGGPRNGVMTALDDFMAEHPEPLRLVLLPVYFGLAIVVEQRRLELQPELAAALDRIESRDGKQQLLEVTEAIRLRGMVFQHNVYYQRDQKEARAADRYLEVVKGSLLNEHHLEHEARLELLTQSLRTGRPPEVDKLRDPARANRDVFERLRRERRLGVGREDGGITTYLPYTAMGRVRLDHLHAAVDRLEAEAIPGDFAEFGTGRGGGAIFLRAHLEAHETPDRTVWLADRFRAAPEGETSATLGPEGPAGLRPDLNMVRDGFDRFHLLDERVRFLQGPPEATLADAPIDRLALLRIGHNSGSHDTEVVLDALYDAVSTGGLVVVEDHADPAVAETIGHFRAQRGVTAVLERVDHTTVCWRKGADEPVGRPAPTPVPIAPRAPLAPPLPTDPVDLSVVVVFYNMKREAERTLHSLSRAYQEGLDDVTYEVIAVDNGSAPDQRLTEEFVTGFGAEFRFIDLADDATPSPVVALNRGIAQSRGRSIALMIDGAHVLTPGVLHFGLLGLRAHAPAIVATQQWYLGPGQQGEAMDDGYDQAYEDKLLEQIAWPTSGYRLFEIGNFIGTRDWLDGMWESNCMFIPRSLMERVGGFDESFSIAGGGYGNLDLYERLGSGADVTVVSILGEGSFHQTHGGTTTNQPDPVERRERVFSYGQEFAELRGRRFRGPGKPIHYVGRITSAAARRTKARRLTAPTFAVPDHHVDGPPTTPTPVPEDLVKAYTDAVWRNMAWSNVSWMGRPVETPPTDLFAYQQTIAAQRPDWIIETGPGTGGRSAFLASVCDLLDHGTVVSVGPEPIEDRVQHPRIHHVGGPAHHPDTVAAVMEVVGPDAAAMVVLGSCTDRYKTNLEFEAYSPMVPVGSYVVVERTIVNGHPVWAAFGPGPDEAVKQILTAHGSFAPDSTMELYSLSFNPGGFLKRVG